MGAPPDSVRESKAEGAAELVSYLGVAPLVLGLLGVGLLPDLAERDLAQRLAIAWGAVLLAGCGGVHWGLALAGRRTWRLLAVRAPRARRGAAASLAEPAPQSDPCDLHAAGAHHVRFRNRRAELTAT